MGVVRGLGGQPSFDQTKPWGFGQQAPLTEEYQKILADSIAIKPRAPGQFGDHAQCLPAGMPFMMVATRPLEFVVTPQSTYSGRRPDTIVASSPTDATGPSRSRRAFRATRSATGSRRAATARSVLEVSARPIQGHRAYDASGLPLHYDKIRSKEGFHATRPIRTSCMTRSPYRPPDAALERGQKYVRSSIRRPTGSGLLHRRDRDGPHRPALLPERGWLMPIRRDQPPPDLRYFKQTLK